MLGIWGKGFDGVINIYQIRNVARAVDTANDSLALKQCAFWQTERCAKSGEKWKWRKVRRAMNTGEILQKTLAVYQEAMGDI